jgi:hypothetical protein
MRREQGNKILERLKILGRNRSIQTPVGRVTSCASVGRSENSWTIGSIG